MPIERRLAVYIVAFGIVAVLVITGVFSSSRSPSGIAVTFLAIVGFATIVEVANELWDKRRPPPRALTQDELVRYFTTGELPPDDPPTRTPPN